MTNGNKEPKLPTQQLAILGIARFAEPLALTSVFPYLPEMIASFGVERTEIARWAGLTGAVFSVAQSITAVPWGKASDRFGRKPILLLGLANTAVCFLLWGVATSLPMAITIRALMGGGNGNVGIIRTMVAEMVPEKSLQPRAFSIMPLVWSIGSVFGPAFGGFFARPADQYPNIFGHIEFFKRFPFALPNLMACCIFLISFTTGLLFLKETLHTKRHQRDWGLVLGEKLTRSFKRSSKPRQRRLSFVDAEASAPLVAQSSAMSSSEHLPAPKEEVRTRYSDLFTRQTTIALVSYTFLALHSVAYDQVLPVFLNYPVVEPDKSNTRLPFWFTGGFGLSSDKIGTIYTVYGIACGVIQFFLFPALCARFGVLNCYRVASILFVPLYFLTPYTALLPSALTRYTALLSILLVKGFAVIVGFPCVTILLTNSATSLRVLGTLNGFATTFSALGRAAGPAGAGAVFSWGVRHGYAIAPWYMLGLVAAAGAVVPFWMVEGKGFAKEEEAEEEEAGERASLLRDGRSRGQEDDEDEEVAILEAVDETSESGSDVDEEGRRRKKRAAGAGGYGSINQA
ncbi:hypothetical protein VTJ04DRAFT_3218 [Mycothermus thermophilus]|uniref:uncharacterized protein n=1 Tax=Humicola insolens TaxID=85995 RepID=UPI003744973F